MWKLLIVPNALWGKLCEVAIIAQTIGIYDMTRPSELRIDCVIYFLSMSTLSHNQIAAQLSQGPNANVYISRKTSPQACLDQYFSTSSACVPSSVLPYRSSSEMGCAFSLSSVPSSNEDLKISQAAPFHTNGFETFCRTPSVSSWPSKV